jgi:hypothetical protein
MVGASEHRYREFAGPDGYRSGETKLEFLLRHDASPGPVDPDKVPYYLLLVGDPDEIPFHVQFQLDVQYAVGRLSFPTTDDYALYARRILQVERATAVGEGPRRATFFGTRNPDDRATAMSADHLVLPLSATLAATVPEWSVESVVGAEATKSRLREVLSASDSSLVFAACHGIGFPAGHPRQLAHQGALLCQDWPGPIGWQAAIPEDQYFSADDLDSGVPVSGSIVVLFACYGAGTPRTDDFVGSAGGLDAIIAPRAFVARLAQRLLSNTKGGTLAVLGHVDRAWSYSFAWERSVSHLATFQSVLTRLMHGSPVGMAADYFHERYAEIASDLEGEKDAIAVGKELDPARVAALWIAKTDARNYMLLGDPATRLPVRNQRVAGPMSAVRGGAGAPA